MERNYTWKSGTRCKINAEVAGAELERIQEAHGGTIRPEHVVEAAKPKSAPLHEAFCWDDKAAAAEYREQQARYLMRCICIEVTRGDAEPMVIRNLVNVEDGELGGVYVDIESAMQNEDWQAQIKRDAVRRLMEARAILTQYEYMIEQFGAAAGSVQTALDLIAVEA